MIKQETFHVISGFFSAVIRGILLKPSAHFFLILLSGFLAYANTFNVPFIFDDNRVIIENHLIKSLGSLWPPSGTRWFGTLTFALNYAAGGLRVSGYHYVNLVIHLAAALQVYRFVVLTFRTPFFSADGDTVQKQTVHSAALLAALLFVSHPIQTQAVTYIAQRFASLATLLFLSSIACYAQARLARLRDGIRAAKQGTYTACWYTAAVVCAALAMETKEIAFTLPVVVFIYEIAFFPGRPLTERLRFLAPILLTLLIIPLHMYAINPEGVSAASRATTDLSRHDYLLTQFRVIVTYLRLLVLPVNQMVDYNYGIYRDIFSPPVFLSLVLLMALLLFSFLLLRQGGRGKIPPEMRIAGFGGLWFFITLSVESSIIPITDVIFEHRLYLPSAGIFMAAGVAGAVLVERLGTRFSKSSTGISVIIACILLALPVATHFRNEVWRSEITLWEDVARKSPDNARAQAIIGVKLIESRKIDLAIEHFQEALRIKPDYGDAMICLGNAYLEKGMLDEGYQQYLKALALGSMDFESRAQLMMNLGTYNFKKGFTDRAIYFYQNALSITPNVASIHQNLGQAYKLKGLSSLAAEEFARAHKLNPDRY